MSLLRKPRLHDGTTRSVIESLVWWVQLLQTSIALAESKRLLNCTVTLQYSAARATRNSQHRSFYLDTDAGLQPFPVYAGRWQALRTHSFQPRSSMTVRRMSGREPVPPAPSFDEASGAIDVNKTSSIRSSSPTVCRPPAVMPARCSPVR